MTGRLHLPSRASHWLLMSEGGTTPSFVPITDVTVQFAIPDAEPLRTKVAIFRRQYVESMQLAERPMTAPRVETVAEELRGINPQDLLESLPTEGAPAGEGPEASLPLLKLVVNADKAQRA